MAAQSSTRPSGWFTTTEMASIFGVSVQAFNQSIRKHAAPEHIRKHGRNTIYCARPVIEAWAIARFGSTAAPPGEADLFSPDSSPALEEWRKWRAQRARLDYEEAAKQLIPREDVTRGLLTMADHLRKAGERLQRRFGVEAAKLVDKALDQFEQNIDAIFQAPDDGEAQVQPDRGGVPQNGRRRKAATKKKHAGVRGKRNPRARR